MLLANWAVLGLEYSYCIVPLFSENLSCSQETVTPVPPPRVTSVPIHFGTQTGSFHLIYKLTEACDVPDFTLKLAKVPHFSST